MNQTAKFVLIAIFVLLNTAASILPAAAQTEGSVAIEEIIVTAVRREENLQRVPIAVTAFSGADLVAKGIDELYAIAQRVPSFVFDSQDQAEPNLYIRGVGSQQANDAAAEMPIAIYFDDVYIGRSTAANFELFDLERVEVLRGPQGTLFGRNASGGVIHLISQKPQDEFAGLVRATIGNYNRINLQAMVTGPGTDTVSYRLAASSRNRDGFVLNETTGNDVADEQATSLRAALRFVPSDKLEINLSSDYTRERGTSSAHDTQFTSGFPVVSNPEPRVVNSLTDGLRERDIFGVTLRFDYSMDWAVLSSITGYRDLDLHADWYFAGNDLTDESIESFNTNIEKSHQFSQEFRLAGSSDRMDWVAGVYYFDVSVSQIESFDQFFNGLFNGLGLPEALWTIGNGLLTFNKEAGTDSWAVFAQGTYKLTDRLGLTAGVRHTEDTRKIAVVATVQDGIVPLGALNAPIGISVPGGYSTGQVSQGWNATTPHFALEFQSTDDLLLFVSATEGFKSGVFNGTASTLEEALTPLDPEEVWSYETGLKSQWSDDRLQINASAFYMDFKNLQLGTLIPGQAIIRENAAALVKGLELEVLALATDRLTLQANYSYLNNKFTDEAKKGNVMPRSPKHKINISGAYSAPVGASNVLTARVDFLSQSKFFHEPDNRPSEIQESYNMIDASLQLSGANRAWTLSLWGKNLGDELVTRSQVAVAVIGQNYVNYAPPRTYGVTYSRSF
jgi:iron complex outermembrane receptor protein